MVFADDLVSYFIYRQKKKLEEKTINKYIQKIEIWLNKWSLKMAPEKCNQMYIIFTKINHKENNVLNINFFNLSLNKS
jgi:hypothetical protein